MAACQAGTVGRRATIAEWSNRLATVCALVLALVAGAVASPGSAQAKAKTLTVGAAKTAIANEVYRAYATAVGGGLVGVNHCARISSRAYHCAYTVVIPVGDGGGSAFNEGYQQGLSGNSASPKIKSGSATARLTAYGTVIANATRPR